MNSDDLRFIGKWAGVFDVCVLIPLAGIALVVAVQWYLMSKRNLPHNYWLIAVITFVSLAAIVRLTVWAGEWILSR